MIFPDRKNASSSFAYREHVLSAPIDHSSSAMDKLKALFEGEKEEPKKKGFGLPWVKEAKPDPEKGLSLIHI